MSINGPHYEIPPNVLYREVDGQLVLLNLDSEQYFGLDEIGADMVRRVTETSVEDAVAGLTGEYDVDPEQLRTDLQDLVAALVEAHLLEPIAGGR